MRKNSKKTAKILLTAVLTAAILGTSVTPSFAGQWQQQGGNWKYQNDDGNYTNNGWTWIDGKCYYFVDGILLTNTKTPDGYTVNGNGEWVENGVVQAQNGNATTTTNNANYDPQYPLKGYMEQWLMQDSAGATVWKWDPLNYLETSDNHWEYVMQKAVEEKNPRYLMSLPDLEVSVVAELAGYSQSGLEHVDQNKKTQLVAEVRDFLNSFDWKNATDFQKAVRISERIIEAEYSSESGDAARSYGCLVNNSASCNGYYNAAILLSACVGLPVKGMGSSSHIYPVYLVDGVWLAYEPTTKNDYFTIAEVYKPTFYFQDGTPQLSELGRYCESVGYNVPRDVSNKFSNIGSSVVNGEQRQIIRFK